VINRRAKLDMALVRKIFTFVGFIASLLNVAQVEAAGVTTRASAMQLAHGGVLTGHFEFDMAIVLTFLGMMTYSLLLPENSPKGLARRMIQSLAVLLGVTGIFFAVIGLRNLVLGTL
jgi:hypothetical protein